MIWLSRYISDDFASIQVCSHWFKMNRIMKLIRNPFLYLVLFFIINDCLSQQHSNLSRIFFPINLHRTEYLSQKAPLEIGKRDKTSELEENFSKLGLPFTTEFISLLRTYSTFLTSYRELMVFMKSFTSYSFVRNDNLDVKANLANSGDLKNLHMYRMTLEMRIRPF
jgi:hypothetical protein